MKRSPNYRVINRHYILDTRQNPHGDFNERDAYQKLHGEYTRLIARQHTIKTCQRLVTLILFFIRTFLNVLKSIF